jgi:hypothetical protein
MDPTTLLPFPGASPGTVDADLAEIEAVIALVSMGLATRVRLVGLAHADDVAAEGLALAQAARVAFALERGPTGSIAITLGPRKGETGRRFERALRGRSNRLVAEVPFRRGV